MAPKITIPLTPESSTEIMGKDGRSSSTTLFQLDFELPPPAMRNTHADARSNALLVDQDALSKKLPSPAVGLQASEMVKSRKRSATVATVSVEGDTLTLPPPPSRPRRIIQVKPSASASDTTERRRASVTTTGGEVPSSPSASRKTKATSTITGESEPNVPGKEKPSSSTAARRKMARKTAHSLIERRRRSKMNEEFALLKSMIPACSGDMHKLAILQASIEYIRYLEDCVTRLKNHHHRQTPIILPPPTGPEFHARYGTQLSSDAMDIDDSMAGGKLDEDSAGGEDDDDAGNASTSTYENTPVIQPQNHQQQQQLQLPSPQIEARGSRQSLFYEFSLDRPAAHSTTSTPVINTLSSSSTSFSPHSTGHSTNTSPNIAPLQESYHSPDLYRHQQQQQQQQQKQGPYHPHSSNFSSSSNFIHYDQTQTNQSPRLKSLQASPGLVESKSKDQEAMTALMMLNADRRSFELPPPMSQSDSSSNIQIPHAQTEVRNPIDPNLSKASVSVMGKGDKQKSKMNSDQPSSLPANPTRGMSVKDLLTP